MVDRITPQSRTLYVLITAIHKLHLWKKLDMEDTISNMHLFDLKFKPHGRKSLRNVIDRTTGVLLYSPPGSEHYKLLHLDRFHGSTCHQTPSHGKNIKNDEKRVSWWVWCALYWFRWHIEYKDFSNFYVHLTQLHKMLRAI